MYIHFFFPELMQLTAISLKLEKFPQLLYKLHFFYFRQKGVLCIKECFGLYFPFFQIHPDRLVKYFDIIKRFIAHLVTSWIITVTAILEIFMVFIIPSSMIQKRNILFSIDSTEHSNKILFCYSRSLEIAEKLCGRQEGKLHLLKSQNTILSGLSFNFF